jgi:hypothetical protein
LSSTLVPEQVAIAVSRSLFRARSTTIATVCPEVKDHLVHNFIRPLTTMPQVSSLVTTTLGNSEASGSANGAFGREQQEAVAILLVHGIVANFVALAHIV